MLLHFLNDLSNMIFLTILFSQGAGATGLGVKMVESVGAARQDVVFDLSCDDVNEVIIYSLAVIKHSNLLVAYFS